MNHIDEDRSHEDIDLESLAVLKSELVQITDNGIKRPAADEILSLYRKDPQVFVDVVGVKVSVRALEVFVRLAGALPDETTINISIKKGRIVEDLSSEVTNGIIVGNRWHPVEQSTRNEAAAILKKFANGVGEAIPLSSYLELIASPSSNERVLDETKSHELQALPSGQVNFRELGMAHDLYPYQQVGAEFLVSMANRGLGTLLADQMGLGKTAQAIALVLTQREVGKTLIVCPASLALNWYREISEFAPSISTCIHAGSSRTGLAEGFSPYDVVITSYDTLVSDIGFMDEIGWQLVILDEAQNIRNPNTQRAVCAKRVDRKISLAITGTPVENTLLDAWSISEFVLPILLGRQEEFTEAYPDELDSARALGDILAPVMVRRLVAEVAQDLPELIQIPIAFELDARLRSAYERILEETPSIFAATTSLRVLCAHAREDIFKVEYSKIDYCTKLVQEIFSNNEKVLLFSSFQTSLDRFYSTYTQLFPNICIGVIDGRVEPSERQGIIDVFQGFDGPGILLMNPHAAGVGLNITAANHVIHFNPEWNPALTSQATARAYRRKQKLPVTVHHLYYADTVEEDASDRAEWKRTLAANVDHGSGEV